MKDETLTKLSEVLCNTFHKQEWKTSEEGCDENRLAWKECAMAVIKAYEKDKWKTSWTNLGKSI
jgi:hypothetical protein